MSDRDVNLAFDALEDLLSRNLEDPDSQAVDAWHASFKRTLASAERGPQWPALQARGQLMAAKLNQQVAFMKALQADLRRQMNLQTSGRRALSAYAPSNR